MCEAAGRKVFAGMLMVVFVAAMWLITGGKVDVVAVAAGPVIFSAAAIVFGMLYLSAYHSHLHPEELGYPKKVSKPPLTTAQAVYNASTLNVSKAASTTTKPAEVRVAH